MWKVFVFLLLHFTVYSSGSQIFSITNEFGTSQLINGERVGGFEPSEVYLGEESQLTLQMHNSSDEELRIYFVSGSDFWRNGFRITNSDDIGTVTAKGSQSLVFSFIPNSRGEKTGHVSIYNRDTDELLFEFILVAKALSYYVPKLALSSTEISFQAGQTGSKSVVLRNQGYTPLDITSISIAGADASSFGQSDFEGLIEPGAYERIDISLFTSESGKGAQLVIESNDENSPHKVFLNNAGNNIQPDIVITNKYGTLQYILRDLEILNFPDTKVGQLSDNAIYVENRGKSELLLDIGLTPVSGTESGVFEISGQVNSLIIPPQGGAYVSLNFTPKASGQSVYHLKMTTNDINHDEITFELRGTGISCDYWFDTYPGNIVFGDLEIGKSVQSYLLLENYENAPIFISGASISPPSATSEFKLIEYVGELGNTSENIYVTYQPTELGPVEAKILISIENGCQIYEVPIQGVGIAPKLPELSIKSNVISFDRTHIEETSSGILEIENTGEAALEIYDLQIAGADINDFSIAGRSEIIPPGEKSQFTVSFTPGTVGEKTAELTIVSNDPAGIRTASLQGEAFQSSFWEQHQTGGIALQIKETTDIIDDSRNPVYVEISYTIVNPLSVNVPVTDTQKISEDGFVFFNTFEKGVGEVLRLEQDEITLLNNDKERIGHIQYSYKRGLNENFTRHAILVLHNDLFPPYSELSINFQEGWDYYETGEYPVSMLVPPNNKMPLEFVETPLLLVHGWTGWYQEDYAGFLEHDDVGYWGGTPRWLEEHSNFDTWQLYYPHDMDIARSWPILEYNVDWLYREYGKELNIATHSMGGLVTMNWLMKRRNEVEDRLNKVLFSVPPFYGSYAANKHYKTLLVGNAVEILKGKDKDSPAARDLGMGSDFIMNMHDLIHEERLPDLNGNSKVSDDYIVLAGVTNQDFSSEGFHEESTNHADGVVSISSASLLNYGVKLLTFSGNHDDGRYANSYMSSHGFIPGLMNAYFSKSEDGFEEFIINTQLNGVTGLFDKEGVLFPVGKSISQISDETGTLLDKGNVKFRLTEATSNQVLKQIYPVFYSENDYSLTIGTLNENVNYESGELVAFMYKHKETNSYYLVSKWDKGVGLHRTDGGQPIQLNTLKFYPYDNYQSYSLPIDFKYLQTQLLEIDLSKPDHLNDIQPPLLVSTVPILDAQDVTNKTLDMTFTEPVIQRYGRISIRRVSDDQEVFGIGAGNKLITVSGNTVSIPLLTDLPAGEELYVLVPPTAFRDLNSNEYAGISEKATWRFTTDAVPELLSTTPSTGSVGFSGANLSMTFTEPVIQRYGRISIRRVSDDQEVFGIGAGNKLITVSGNTVSIPLLTDLPAGEELYVLVPPTAFKDLNSNEYAGISEKATWRFTTDAVPELLSTTPSTGSVGFSGENISMTFTEPVIQRYGRISIRRVSDDQEVFGIGAGNKLITVSGNTVSIPLLTDLPAGEELYVLVPPTAFRDLNNNKYVGISEKTTWRFTTDAVPELQSTTPSTGSVGFSGANLSMTFTEPVIQRYGRISIRRVSDDQEVFGIGAGNKLITVSGNTVSIPLLTDLPAGEELYVLVPPTAFRDLNNNKYVGISEKTTWRFTTDAVPELQSTTPSTGSAGFSGTSISMTFNEPVVQKYGRISVRRISDDQEVFGIGAGNKLITVSGNMVSIPLLTDLPAGEELYVLVPPTAFRDLNNNKYVGISEKTTWRFTTDAVPELQSTTPSTGSAGFSGTSISMTFNEPVIQRYGRIRVRRVSDNEEVFGIGAGNKLITVSGNTVNIPLLTDLPVGEELYVLVPSTAFRDLNDNRYPGISEKTIWRFTTDVAHSNAINPDEVGLEINSAGTSDLLKITPNPAMNEALVTFHNGEINGRVQLLLINVNGNVVNRLFDDEMKPNVDKAMTIDLRGLSDGVYLMKLLTPSAYRIVKLLIQK